jgi:hypothetical protein
MKFHAPLKQQRANSGFVAATGMLEAVQLDVNSHFVNARSSRIGTRSGKKIDLSQFRNGNGGFPLRGGML